jgi:HAD superfamily hydrolase (TIGR01484 family)
VINTFEKAYFYKDNNAMVWFRKLTGLENIQAHYNDIDEPWAKIIFGHENEERLIELLQGMEKHPEAKSFDFVHTEKSLMEIMPKGINKGVAIHKFSELLGIDKRKIIAVGDFENDVEMIREAGVGIAVANACPGAKEVADIVTVSNEEHAIAKIIEDIEKGVITFHE